LLYWQENQSIKTKLNKLKFSIVTVFQDLIVTKLKDFFQNCL